MKKIYFPLSAISLAMFLQSCATAPSDQALQTSKKEKPKICEHFDYKKDNLSGTYDKVYEIWREFDEYYDDVQAPNGRKLAVFLDGTNNDKKDATNIRDMYLLAVAQACDDKPVVPYYDKGVGANFFQQLQIFPLVTGMGVSLNIRQAYRFLSQAYKSPDKRANKQGDEIYIFGFSRGALTARSLNGFIEFAGLLDGTTMKSKLAKLPTMLHWTTKFELMVDDVYDKYNTASNLADADFKRNIQNHEATKYPQEKFYPSVKVTVIGVFDTVPALGLKLNPTNHKPEMEYDPNNHKLELYANKGFHALSLDEHRSEFILRRFNKEAIKSNQILSEVWFPGVHSNVGGGYAKTIDCDINNKDHNSLETTPLNWMISKLKDEHLFPEISPFQECQNGQLHDEFYDSKALWSSMSTKRILGKNEVIHESVLCRMQFDKLYTAHDKTEPNGKYQPTLPNSYLIESTRLGGIIDKFDVSQCQLKTPQ